MKRIRSLAIKVICLGVLLIMFLGIFTSCENKGIWHDVKIGFQIQSEKEHPNLLTLVDTTEKLRHVCDEHGLVSDSTYDSAFFDEYAMVIYIFTDSKYVFQFDTLKIENEILEIIVMRLGPAIDEETHFSYSIKVRQNDVKNIKEVKTSITDKNK